MDYSVFDWALEKWRVFRAPAKDDGLFDPTIAPRKTDLRFGLAPEAVSVSLPAGAAYVGVSTLPRGRVAVDTRARAQARATLPVGLGASPEGVGELDVGVPRPLAYGAAGALLGGLATGKWKGAAVGGVLGWLLSKFLR